MHVTRLTIHNLRCIRAATLQLSAGMNFIGGVNGAGKTSVLEALHLLAWGRSFRGRVRDGLIQSQQQALDVFIQYQDSTRNSERRLGLRHDGQQWQGRIDGETAKQLGDICAALAVVTFEPGSHALVDGSAEIRRRFMDWGLFHVEQDFHPQWRRYQRALKQRNALLKQRQPQAQALDAWDNELADAGEAITRMRAQYLQRLAVHLIKASAAISPALGMPALMLHAGWKRDQLPLADALLLARQRDIEVGFTSVGAHRADWSLTHSLRPANEALSRGQAKLAALACLLAQAEDYATQMQQWPVILLDDLASELDKTHQQKLLQYLLQTPAQVIITGTDLPDYLQTQSVNLFHVEQGQVSPVTRPAEAVDADAAQPVPAKLQ